MRAGRFFEGKNRRGDVHGLGGDAIDEELTRRVLTDIRAQPASSAITPGLRDRLKQVVEELKIDALSSGR